jgi:hypothetical protein
MTTAPVLVLTLALLAVLAVILGPAVADLLATAQEVGRP